MQEIYFDNSATTKVSPAAAEAALAMMVEDYGNPSSAHKKGAAAFHLLNSARSLFAELLLVPKDEIYFTSCGTESNNTIIHGLAKTSGKNSRILISAIEHPSVYDAARYYLSLGFQVEEIPVTSTGLVDISALNQLLGNDVALVSIMHVNNEVGTIQPLSEIGQLIKSKAPAAFFHVDAVQSFGRLPVNVKSWQADAISISGHKIHAPKGVGLLWLSADKQVPPLLIGGGQEHGFRSGTENISSIAAFAVAARECYADMPGHYQQLGAVKNALLEQLAKLYPEHVINSPVGEAAANYIVNISFPGLRSEVLLHSLEEQGLYVSAGSACTSTSSKGSRILTAMQLPPQLLDSAIRFSFSRYNTVEEAETAAKIVAKTATELQQIMNFKNNKRKR